jgi:hypothetical protein
VLAYGTASAALGQVLTRDWLGAFGPSLALVALLLAAQWGAYQGPVVFSVADVAFLLGAPLPRRALAIRRLVVALAGGAVVGAAAAGVVLVGLAGEGRGVDTMAAAGLVVGLAELGTLAVAGAWAVERSARVEQAVRRATWPVVLAAAGLVAASDAGAFGRSVALWAGPWGWALQSNVGVARAEWLAALVVLTVLTAVAAGAAMRTCGQGTGERHLRRAEARAGATASLASFDGRTARQVLAAVGARGPAGSGAGAGWLRRALATRGARPTARTLAIVWRDAVAARRAPGRVVEAAALTGGGTLLCLLDADKPVAVAAGMFLVYLGASRLLWPLRVELDVPGRTATLLRPRIGHVLLAHALLPTLVIASAAALTALGCAIAGALPAPGAIAGVAAVAATPAVTCCAAMSARRGGRVPQSLLVAAIAADPTGGGATITAWLAAWPATAAILGSLPVLLVTGAGLGAALPAAGLAALAVAGLAYALGRDPVRQ